MTDITTDTRSLHRSFWEAGLRVFGLHGVTPKGACACGDPTCKAVLKHPLMSNWQHTPHWSDEQMETMEAMGQFKTGYGILCRIDDEFDLLVVDVDARNNGLQDYERLLQKVHAVAGAGLIVNTGSGGGSKHLFFKVKKGMALLTKHPDFMGIDFKSGSAYVVGAGSLHASGNRYQIVVGSPDDIDLAPQALLDMLVKPEHHRTDFGGQTVDVSHADLADMLRHIDGCDDYDVWIKVGMALHHASGGSALNVWEQWSSKSTKYNPEEMPGKWSSFGKSANPVTLGTLVHFAEKGGWTQPVTFQPDVEFSFEAPTQTMSKREPEMRFLGNRGIPAPVLPLEALVASALAAELRHIAKAKGAPVDYVFAALLTSAATLLSSHVVACPSKGWIEPAILWTVLIGEPSSSKSPALDAIIAIMKRIEKELNSKEQKTIEEWEDKDKISQAIDRKWQKEMQEAIEKGDPPPPKPENSRAVKRPKRSRLIVNDATIERLADIIGGQQIGILAFRDELAGWLEGMFRYANGGSDRGFWLEAYGGRPYSVERMTREVTVDRLAISVLGGIQPDRMNTLLLNVDDDGLLARMIPIWPAPAPIEKPVHQYNDSIVSRTLHGLHMYAVSVVHTGKPEPSVLPFRKDACEGLLELRRHLRSMEANEEGLMKSFLGKVPGLTVRVALVLAHINAVAEGKDIPLEITLVDFEAARSFAVEYVLPMARRAYEVASISKTERAARQVLWLAKANCWETVRIRDIKRRGRNGLTDDKDIQSALSMLVAAEWLKEEPSPKSNRGGRPTLTYHVNPRLWTV